jgi:peptide/nickel transport system ATP-binding protein
MSDSTIDARGASPRPARAVADGAPLLAVDDLRITFPGKGGLLRGRQDLVAVDGVSFDVRRGETVGLVGESGSGKSTTARAVLRLVDVASGRITFAGHDVTAFGRGTPLWYRRSVQAVFQDPASSLNPRHVVSKAVTKSLRRHGVSTSAERERAARDAFERVGLLPDHLDRLPGELSGGQQQRVAIARALALQSDLVICDEAVSALDLSTQAQIVNLLDDLQASMGLSYLFIAHDLGVVRDICDRIVVMYLGRVVEVSTKDRLFAHPKHPYTRALLAATPASHPDHREERRARRAAYHDSRTYRTPPRGGEGCPFRTRCARVMDVCVTTPPVVALADGSQVACHLYDGEHTVEPVTISSRLEIGAEHDLPAERH